MASLAKRKELVNELRRAHFPFGFQNNKGAQSQYVQKYKEYEALQNQQKSQNARQVHFSVTDSNGNTNYVSQFKQKYPQHELGAKQDPRQYKNSQVDKNFVFGYDPNSFGTNYNDDFQKQNNVPERRKPILQNQPHISLGDSLTNFATTYKQTHNEKQASRVYPGDPQMIRKSNMILGDDKTNFLTQNNSTYVQKPINNYHITQKSNVSNIKLGNDNNGFLSEQKQNYFHKQSNAQPVDKNRVRDFKNAHFHFGFPQPTQHLSQAKDQFNEKPINFKKAEPNRASNLDFNVDGKDYFNTTYNNQFLPKKGGKGDLFKKVGQIDNVLMGADKNPGQYVSEARAQFNSKQSNGNKPNAVYPVQTLDIGKGQGQYLTHNQDIHSDKFGQRQNNRLTGTQLNRLKGVNFKTGFKDGEYKLTSQGYGIGSAPANKLSKQVLDSMKNANIAQGTDNPFKGGTTYKASYHWKNGEQN